MTYINIEQELDVVVRRLGGCRITELVGPSPGFENADYLFDDDRAVIELKILETDHFTQVSQRTLHLINEWISQGLLPETEVGSNSFDTASLPHLEQRRVFEKVRDAVQRPIKKANLQIRHTKERLNRRDYKGLLLLANDRNTLLELDVVAYLLASLLLPCQDGSREFSSIDRIVYFTANMPGFVSGLGTKVQVWATPRFPGDDESMSPFLKRLELAWHRHMEELSGAPIPTFSSNDADGFRPRFRDPALPINSSKNRLLVDGYRFPDNFEQELLDSLGEWVSSLRKLDVTAIEVARVMVRQLDLIVSPPQFPVFNRLCNGFGVHSIYLHSPIPSLEGMNLVSILISKNAVYDLNTQEEPITSALPFRVELHLLNRLPTLLGKLEASDKVELCRLELNSDTTFEPTQCMPCVIHFCSELGIRVKAHQEGMGWVVSLVRHSPNMNSTEVG